MKFDAHVYDVGFIPYLVAQVIPEPQKADRSFVPRFLYGSYPNRIPPRGHGKKNTKHMLKKLLYGILTAVMSFAFVSCEDDKANDRYEQEEEEKDYEYLYTQTGLYLGITGFNSDLQHYTYRPAYYPSVDYYRLLNTSTSNSFKEFVSTLKTDDGTILYYAMDNTISLLEKSKFPDDLKNVSIITFTDGLDQGSSVKNPNYQSASAYLEAIQNRIRTTKINKLNISAYSIGLKGQDVKDETQFKSNLKGLASSETNVMEVTSMDEVNDKFMQLAASLYKKNTSQSLTLTIPQPYNNTKIRFTFDIGTEDDAANSACYIEGIFNNGALTQIQYNGITSNSGSSVKGESAGSINISFTFENIQLETASELVTSRIKQWEWVSNSNLWQINSEFNPDKSTETTVEMQSAVIILLLDCSSSLGSDLEKVKKTAQNFITALSGASDGEITLTSQVRFKKQGYYYCIPQLLLATQEQEILASYNFASSPGISPYYEIPTGHHVPMYYYNLSDSPNYGYLLKETPYTYYFAGGKRYTITCAETAQGYYSYNINCDN